MRSLLQIFAFAALIPAVFVTAAPVPVGAEKRDANPQDDTDPIKSVLMLSQGIRKKKLLMFY